MISHTRGQGQQGDMRRLPCGCICGDPLATRCAEAVILADALRQALAVYELERDALALALDGYQEGQPFRAVQEEQIEKARTSLWVRRAAAQAFHDHYWPQSQREGRAA